jgi:hypothetical protein
MMGPRVCGFGPARPVKLLRMFAMALRCPTAGAEA